MARRKEQVAEALRQLAAEFLERESNRSSLITVTRAEVGERQSRATIYLTVLPDSEEETALEFARRKRGVFRDYLNEKLHIHPLPFIDFVIDLGEKNRQRIDELGLQDREAHGDKNAE